VSTLRVTNRAGTLHNLSVPALQVDLDLLPGATVLVAVTLPPAARCPSSASCTRRSARRASSWPVRPGLRPAR